MLKRIQEIPHKQYLAIGVLFIITLALSLQSYFAGSKSFGSNTSSYTHYNNYNIFKQSFFHLVENKDLYALYPNEHWDYYKYSPAFALLMAPLAILPDAVGLFFWNLLNALVLFVAIWKLPVKPDKKRWLMFGFIVVELITSLQNSQSNALMAGLIVLALVFLERDKPAWASLMIVLTVFVKLFGVLGFALFLFYPRKVQAAVYTILWIVVFIFLPLLVVPPAQMLFLYKSWWALLSSDHSASYGLSVMGWLHTWFGIDSLKNGAVMIGGIVLILPLLRFKFYKELQYRLLFLSSILVWMVIFNHKAESPTFIIAITGVAIWFFTQQMKVLNLVLLVLVLLFTILSPTDLFPKIIRVNYVIPYVLKVVPCILIWVKIVYDLLAYTPATEELG